MIVNGEITLDHATHTYWDQFDRRVLGVSELLSDQGYIGKFLGNEDALKRGRNVHLAIEYFEKGTLDQTSLSPRLKPYFDSYLGFKETTGFRVLRSECLVYDPLVRLACTLDAVGEIAGRPCVIDYKTGPVSRWVGYQTAAHVNGLPPLADKGEYLRFGLYLRPDGDPAVLIPFEDPTDLAVIRMFASSFYRRVNDGVIDWPQTRAGLEKQRREEYGLELFPSPNDNGIASDRNVEDATSEIAIAGLDAPSRNGV